MRPVQEASNATVVRFGGKQELTGQQVKADAGSTLTWWIIEGFASAHPIGNSGYGVDGDDMDT